MFITDPKNSAKILINRGEGKFNANHRKENRFSGEYVAINPENGSPVLTLRIYWTDSRCYAAAWLNVRSVKGARGPLAEGVYMSGTGYAGGYGYCKESAAAAAALEAANIELSEPISGRGIQAIQDAVAAVAIAAGVEKPIIHKSHS